MAVARGSQKIPLVGSIRTVTMRRASLLRLRRRGGPAAVGAAVCGFDAPLRFSRGFGGILHSPLRDTHQALRFLFILRKRFFPKLHICALHTRELPAFRKCLEQLSIFSQPRLNESAPFLASHLQGCA